MISNSTKYAIRAILYLSKAEEGKKYIVEELSKALDIPQPYLSKILQQLSRSNIISSTKGRGGGFFLSEDNLNRPLIDIVECIEGHNVFNKCLLGLHQCSDNNPCLLHTDYKVFKSNLERTMIHESIKNLLDGANYKI